MMTYKICYWDSEECCQKERDATPEEAAEIESRKAEWEAGQAQRDKDAHNAPIIAQLDTLDIKRIRPTAEGDTAYLAILNAQVLALRSKLA